MLKILNVLGYKYALKSVLPTDTLDAHGRFIPRTQEIHIADDLSKEEKVSVILHELLEGINYHLELELEHKAITCLETALYQVLTSNGVNLAPLLRKR